MKEILILAITSCGASALAQVVAPATLVFDGKQTDPRSASERKADEDSGVESVRQAARANGRPMNAAMEASVRAGIQMGDRPERFRITLSMDGERILFEDEVQGVASVYEGKPRHVVTLYDGRDTYVVNQNGHHLDVYPGRTSLWMNRLPLPGVSVGSYDLIGPVPADFSLPAGVTLPKGYRLTRVAITGSTERATPFNYTPGVVKDVGGRISKLYAGLPGSALESWSFSRYRSAGGTAVAGKTLWCSYRSGEDGWVTDKPELVREYDLRSFAASALPAARFAVSSYVLKGASVTDYRDRAHPIRYAYDPEVSLDEMRRRSESPDGRAGQEARP